MITLCQDVQLFWNSAKLAKLETVNHVVDCIENKIYFFVCEQECFEFRDAKPNFRGERAERPSVIRYAVGIVHARPGGPAFFESLDFFLEISIFGIFPQTTHSFSRQ